MKPWWKTYPRSMWTAVDWEEARRLGVVPSLPNITAPIEPLPVAGRGMSWGQPPSKADRQRREVARLEAKFGLRLRRW
jgi:hypothetical protein